MSRPHLEVLAEAKRLYDTLPAQIEIHSPDHEGLEKWRVLVRDYVPELWLMATTLRDLVLEQKAVIDAWEAVAPDKKAAVKQKLRGAERPHRRIT